MAIKRDWQETEKDEKAMESFLKENGIKREEVEALGEVSLTQERWGEKYPDRISLTLALHALYLARKRKIDPGSSSFEVLIKELFPQMDENVWLKVKKLTGFTRPRVV